MTDLQIHLCWTITNSDLKSGKNHIINFDDFTYVTGDAAADWGGDTDRVNPEQLLAASVSSCHMMTFLALAEKAGWSLTSYVDVADAALGKGPNGRMTVTEINLSPAIELDDVVTSQQIEEMHERAHRYCFVANALCTKVNIKPNFLTQPEPAYAN